MGGYIPGGGGAYNRKCFFCCRVYGSLNGGLISGGGGLYKRKVYGINGIHARLFYRPP